MTTQPTHPWQACTVTNGTGTVGSADVSGIAVACATSNFTVGGTVAGLLSGNSLVLQNRGSGDLTLTTNGGFAFATPVASGQPYEVTVSRQPTSPEQNCTVTAGLGAVEGANVTSVALACGPALYRIQGVISGLTGSGLTLATSGLQPVAVSAGATAFTFPVGLPTGSPYEVYVASQPAGQVCEVTSAVGTVSDAAASVSVNCRAPADWASNCGDLAEHEITRSWYALATQPTGKSFTSSVQEVADAAGPYGRNVVRVVTSAASDFALVRVIDPPFDARSFGELRMQVRSSNTNPLGGWQGNFPVVVLRDSAGNRASYTPNANLLPTAGGAWVPVNVPLSGGLGWVIGLELPESNEYVSSFVDLSSIVAIEIHANTWEWNSWVLDVDGLSFARSGDTCSPNVSSAPAIGPFLLGGTVRGLTSSGLVLSVTGEPPLAVSGGSSVFAMGAPLFRGTSYDVAVQQQPVGSFCSVVNSSGRVPAGDVVGVDVTCTTRGDAEGTIRAKPAGGQCSLVSTAAGVLQTGGVDVGGASSTSAALLDPTGRAYTDLHQMNVARVGHSMTTLSSGKVLVAGGDGGGGTAEVWDPASRTFQLVPGGMRAARSHHTATTLGNGKVLLAGGSSPSGAALQAAEVYDPMTGVLTTTGAMQVGRIGHAATPLPDGTVLITGGATSSAGSSAVATAEVYDPSTGRFTLLASSPMTTARAFHTATLLPSGDVLVAGGGGQSPTATAEIFEFRLPHFTATSQPMAQARRRHTATLLPSGLVLLATGEGGSGLLDGSELFDPSSGTFAPAARFWAPQAGQQAVLLPSGVVFFAGGVTASGAGADGGIYLPLENQFSGSFGGTAGPMLTSRSEHTATLLRNGHVLIAGGWNGATLLSQAELYDPATGTFSSAGTMTTPRVGHTSTLLSDGTVLLASDGSAEIYDPAKGSFGPVGGSGPAWSGHSATLLADGAVLFTGGYYSVLDGTVFDPSTGTAWAATSSMSAPRIAHTATRLADGTVLVVGGTNGSESPVLTATADIFDPATRAFRPTGSMRWPRSGHTATLLPDGRVLVTGGSDDMVSEEVYDPATGTFSAIGSLFDSWSAGTAAALLPDGTVLLVGGVANTPTATPRAGIFVPGAETIRAPPQSPGVAHSYDTVTVLPNGQVLMAGSTSELYVP